MNNKAIPVELPVMLKLVDIMDTINGMIDDEQHHLTVAINKQDYGWVTKSTIAESKISALRELSRQLNKFST